MRPALALVFGLLLAAVMIPPQAAAQRDCCFGGSTPPALEGARLPAASADAARVAAERLGFTWSPPRDDEGEVVGLARFPGGALAWGPATTTSEFGALSDETLRPIVTSHFYLICYPVPEFRPFGAEPGAWHPSGVIGVVGVIGLVGRLGHGQASMGHPDRWDFSRPALEPDLGARASEARYAGGGFVRLVAPVDEGAPAAEWAERGLDRWIGLVLECQSLDVTAAWFDAHQIAYRWVDRSEDALLVEPEAGGGVVLEFVLKGWRPRA